MTPKPQGRTPQTRAGGPNYPHNYGGQLTEAVIARRRHRDVVGGFWDEVGRLQFEFVRDRGLLPSHTFLDVGCGALRGGVHFIRYLEAGHYFGTDLNASLLKAGETVELVEAGLTDKKPTLLVDDRFSFASFGVTFDAALALSVFTHLPVNSIARCLGHMARVLKPGGRFFATYFEAPAPHCLEPLSHPSGVTTHSDADPFHYHFGLFEYLVTGLRLRVTNLGAWGHPRGQHMLEFLRTGE